MIKRRKLLQYVPASVAISAGLLARKALSSQTSSQSASTEEAHRHKWVVLYWMPYDNDLSRFGESMEAEATNMYQTLTLVDNQAIAQLPTYLAPLLQVLKDNSTDINMMDLPTYRYFGERHCDLLYLLEQAVETRGRGSAEFQRFADFVTASVIAHCATEGHLYRAGALMRSPPEHFCGIGMYCPTKDDPAAQYRSMALSQAVDLDSLYKTIA